MIPQKPQCPFATRRGLLARLAAALSLGPLAFPSLKRAVAANGSAMQGTGHRLYLLEDLDDVAKTSQLARGDLAALRSVASWIRTFVVMPHKDLGREGTVCPFVPVGIERKILWLACQHSAGRSVPEVVRLVNEYKSQFLHAHPIHGDGLNYKSVIVVFPDLAADRAKGVFDEVLKQLAVPSYSEDGVVLGAFHKNNEGTAIYNRGFRPFMSPAPFLLMRHTVVSDWKFFLDDEEWLDRWAHRHGHGAVRALAAELRRFPWRAQGRALRNT